MSWNDSKRRGRYDVIVHVPFFVETMVVLIVENNIFGLYHRQTAVRASLWLLVFKLVSPSLY